MQRNPQISQITQIICVICVICGFQSLSVPQSTAQGKRPPNVQVLLTNRCKLTIPEIERFWQRAIRKAAEVNTAAESVPDPKLFLVELPGDFPCEDDDEGMTRCMGFFVRGEPMLVLFSHKDHPALEHEFLHMVLWQLHDRRWRCARHQQDWQRGCFPS